MTAAEVMDVTARPPDCAGQAAHAVSACTQVRMEGCPYVFGYVFHDINGHSHGQTLKIHWFLLGEICTDTHLQASCGKDNVRLFYWEKYRIGNVC